MQNANIHTARVDDSDYPQRLLELESFPSELHYIGSPVWQNRLCIAVVGSRDPSSDAEKWLDFELAQFIRKIPCVIVSGGARGIDQLAHKIAIRNQVPTVMFLPSGLRKPYPHYLDRWYEMVLGAGGAIVSHLPHNEAMTRDHFLDRNMWIAGMSDFTVAIEARRKSGTSMTARYALGQGRSVGVMPTHPTDKGMGGLDLIYEGATLLRDHWDIMTLCQLQMGAR